MEPSEQDHADIARWLDTARINHVVGGYFRALDEKHFDESRFRELLSPDAEIVRPNGASVVGLSNIVESHARSFARFEATQHLLTGQDAEIDGGTATVRANLVAIHIWKDRPAEATMLERSFTAGGVIVAALARTPEGWRICRTENRVIWRSGFFGDMLQFSYETPGHS